jgi:hypothetical protein
MLPTEHKFLEARKEHVTMVYVLDKQKEPLMPCAEKRARLLLERGRARVHKGHPFTIRRVASKHEDSVLPQLILKIDPGSKQTDIALNCETESTAKVVSDIEFKHRGRQISEPLQPRAAFRRRSKAANLRSSHLVCSVQDLIGKERASAPA